MTCLWISVFLFYCGFRFSSVDTSKCSNFRFYRQLERKLQCSIYKKLMDIHVMDCHEKCVSELSCFSVNFYQNENGTSVCEMVKGTQSSLENPDCLVWKNESEHSEFLNPCSCSSSASCEAGKIRKALPGNWYRLGSSVFKHFEQKKTYAEAGAVCSANGGQLATINSDDENKFVTEFYLEDQLSKTELFIKDTLKPYKHWKLDGSDKDVTLLGSLVAKKDEYNKSSVLYFPGTAGSFATTPAWGISTMTFSISLWVKLDGIPPTFCHLYSYWSSPYLFYTAVYPNGDLSFSARKKSNHNSDLFSCHSGQIVPNKWTHIVVVWNRETKQATVYLDGSKTCQTTPLTAADIDLPVPIRSVFDVGYKRDSGFVLKGWLRELLVFDRALTSEDVNVIQDATLLDPRIWIGPPQSYFNLAPVPQPNTNCFSAKAWGHISGKKCRVTENRSSFAKNRFNQGNDLINAITKVAIEQF